MSIFKPKVVGPEDGEAAVYLVWLMETARLPVGKALALVEHFGDGRQVWRQKPEAAARAVALTGEEQGRLGNKSLTRAQGILDRCQQTEVQVLTIFQKSYPQRLKAIHDPPLVLYVLGKLPDLNHLPAIAVVGHRSATPYGLSAAERIGYQLAREGYVVVSGMAKGIDGASHRGAVLAEGITVAVFGTAIDTIYPAENTELYRDILRQGAVLSEYPPGKPGNAGFFPRRNRIISGLSLGTVVVEAGRRSGSLITAGLALDQGRDVFAVPGAINAASSEGTNDLIKKGAKLISDAYDVIAEYAPLYGGDTRPPAPSPRAQRAPAMPPPTLRAAFEQAESPEPPPKTGEPILDALDKPRHVDELVAALGQPEHQVLAALTVHELSGRVRQLPGKFFQRI